MSKTYGQQFDEATKCTTKEEAAAWMEKEIVRYWLEYKMGPLEAKSVILQNLGYMAGYYAPEMGKKVDELFGAKHPIFGDVLYKEK